MVKRCLSVLLAVATVFSLGAAALADEGPIAAEGPVVTEVPIAAEVPVVTEVPIAAEGPVVTEVPVVAEEPIAAEEPVAAEVPVAVEEPVATEGPAVTEVPVAEEVPVVEEQAAPNGPEEVPSGEASQEQAQVGLAMPSITAASATAKGINIQWGAVTGAAKYRVFYKTASGWKRLGDTTGTSFVWTGAQSGTTYTLTVRCVSADGKSFTSAYDKKGVSVTYNTVPQLKPASAAVKGVKLQWGAVAGAAKYRVFYKTADGWKKLGDTAKTSFVWTGAQSGTKYTFTVRCLSADGKSYTSAYDKKGVSLLYIAAPVLSPAANAAKGVKLQWGAVAGAAKYRVFYKTASGWKKLGDTTKTSFVWTAAQSGTKYTFTVRCVSANGKSFTSAYDAAGVSIHYLAMPEISKLANTSGGIKVTWSKVTGAVKYRLYCKVGSGSWSRVATTTGTSYTVKGLSSGVAYSFTVRSCGKDGVLSGYDEGRRTMVFTNSPLVSYTRISPNRFPDRNNIIDTITIHCVVGQCTVEGLGATFAPTSKSASSNYGIGADGRIGMYVEEKDSSKCSSDRPNDHRAVTIEVASDTYDPYWVNPTAYASLIDLVTDICQRNGIEKLVWSTNKNDRVNHLNGCNMTVHRDYANKSCPGAYLYDRMGQIAAEVNARLSG